MADEKKRPGRPRKRPRPEIDDPRARSEIERAAALERVYRQLGVYTGEPPPRRRRVGIHAEVPIFPESKFHQEMREAVELPVGVLRSDLRLGDLPGVKRLRAARAYIRQVERQRREEAEAKERILDEPDFPIHEEPEVGIHFEAKEEKKLEFKHLEEKKHIYPWPIVSDSDTSEGPFFDFEPAVPLAFEVEFDNWELMNWDPLLFPNQRVSVVFTNTRANYDYMKAVQSGAYFFTEWIIYIVQRYLNNIVVDSLSHEQTHAEQQVVYDVETKLMDPNEEPIDAAFPKAFIWVTPSTINHHRFMRWEPLGWFHLRKTWKMGHSLAQFLNPYDSQNYTDFFQELIGPQPEAHLYLPPWLRMNPFDASYNHLMPHKKARTWLLVRISKIPLAGAFGAHSESLEAKNQLANQGATLFYNSLELVAQTTIRAILRATYNGYAYDDVKTSNVMIMDMLLTKVRYFFYKYPVVPDKNDGKHNDGSDALASMNSIVSSTATFEPMKLWIDNMDAKMFSMWYNTGLSYPDLKESTILHESKRVPDRKVQTLGPQLGNRNAMVNDVKSQDSGDEAAVLPVNHYDFPSSLRNNNMDLIINTIMEKLGDMFLAAFTQRMRRNTEPNREYWSKSARALDAAQRAGPSEDPEDDEVSILSLFLFYINKNVSGRERKALNGWLKSRESYDLQLYPTFKKDGNVLNIEWSPFYYGKMLQQLFMNFLYNNDFLWNGIGISIEWSSVSRDHFFGEDPSPIRRNRLYQQSYAGKAYRQSIGRGGCVKNKSQLNRQRKFYKHWFEFLELKTSANNNCAPSIIRMLYLRDYEEKQKPYAGKFSVGAIRDTIGVNVNEKWSCNELYFAAITYEVRLVIINRQGDVILPTEIRTYDALDDANRVKTYITNLKIQSLEDGRLRYARWHWPPEGSVSDDPMTALHHIHLVLFDRGHFRLIKCVNPQTTCSKCFQIISRAQECGEEKHHCNAKTLYRNALWFQTKKADQTPSHYCYFDMETAPRTPTNDLKNAEEENYNGKTTSVVHSPVIISLTYRRLEDNEWRWKLFEGNNPVKKFIAFATLEFQKPRIFMAHFGSRFDLHFIAHALVSMDVSYYENICVNGTRILRLKFPMWARGRTEAPIIHHFMCSSLYLPTSLASLAKDFDLPVEFQKLERIPFPRSHVYDLEDMTEAEIKDETFPVADIFNLKYEQSHPFRNKYVCAANLPFQLKLQFGEYSSLIHFQLLGGGRFEIHNVYDYYKYYCLMDSFVLGLVWERFSTQLVEYYVTAYNHPKVENQTIMRMLNKSVTLPAFAERLYIDHCKRRGHDHQLKNVANVNDKRDFVLASIIGGVSYTRRLDVEDRLEIAHNDGLYDFSVVDVRSLYPFAMQMNRYPVGDFEETDKYEGDEFLGIYEVDMIMPFQKYLYPWPRTIDKNADPEADTSQGFRIWRCVQSDRMEDPKGRLLYKQIMTSVDMIRLRDEFGCEFPAVYRGIFWRESDYVFQDWYSIFTSAKMQQDEWKQDKDERYNPALRQCLKLIANAKYGKTMEKVQYSKLKPCKSWNDLHMIDFEDILNIPLYFFNNYFILRERQAPNQRIPLHHGSFVLANSRNVIWDFAKRVGLDKVYAMETDSLFIRRSSLLQLTTVISREFGKLDLCYPFIYGYYPISKKCYCFSYQKKNKKGEKEEHFMYKFKGIPKRYLTRDLYKQLYENGFCEVDIFCFIRSVGWLVEQKRMKKKCTLPVLCDLNIDD
jgi:hypothetical protein